MGLTKSTVLVAATAGILQTLASANAAQNGSVRCYSMDASWRLVTATLPPLNHGLVEETFKNYGQVVGTGECAAIPDLYLRAAKAENYDKLGPTGPDADYVWGSFVTAALPGAVNLSAVLPGDIVQMRGVSLTETWGNLRFLQAPSHHTAIVWAIGADGRDLCVLEQGEGLNVGYGWYNLNGLTQGTLWFYRPVY